MKEQKIGVVIAESWADAKTVDLVARGSGAQPAQRPSAAGAGTDGDIEFITYNVAALARALR